MQKNLACCDTDVNPKKLKNYPSLEGREEGSGANRGIKT